MRAAIWSAVSSKPQLHGRDPAKDDEEDAGDSLAEQIKEAKAICEQRGWTIVAELQVPGHSRSSYWQYAEAAADMEAYADLQYLAQSHAMDVVICRDLDRLGRSDSLLGNVQHLLRENGVQIFEMSNPTVIAEPQETEGLTTGQLFQDAFKRANVQAELLKLRRYHRTGMIARIKHRGLPPGPLPYGYRQLGDNKVPPVQVEEEVAVIRKVRELYLRGWGASRIIGWLNEHGPPPPRAEAWCDPTIRKLLDNPFYAGIITYGQLTAPGKHEPIWTPAEWAELRAERRRRRVTRGKSASPFSGLVRCRTCNASMVYNATRPGRQYAYFLCTKGSLRKTEQRKGYHRCCVRVERIREAVLDKVAELQDPEGLKEACRDREAEQRATLQRDRQKLEAKLEEHGVRVRRLLDAHTRWGHVSVEAFDEAMAKAADQQAAYEVKLAEAIAMQEALPSPERRVELIVDLASRAEEVLDSEDVKEANAWLAGRVRAIWCEGREVVGVELV